MAVRLQMRMARLLAPSHGLQDAVRERVEQALAESTDPYERHTLVNTAVSALNDAGLSAKPNKCCWPNCRVRIRRTTSC
jgi:hypothetical protein